jgi:hypothetical protein
LLPVKPRKRGSSDCCPSGPLAAPTRTRLVLLHAPVCRPASQHSAQTLSLLPFLLPALFLSGISRLSAPTRSQQQGTTTMPFRVKEPTSGKTLGLCIPEAPTSYRPAPRGPLHPGAGLLPVGGQGRAVTFFQGCFLACGGPWVSCLA